MIAHYANLTYSISDWKLHFHTFPYGESLFILLVFLYGLKIQLQNPNRQRNLRLIKDFQRKMVQLFGALLNYCAHIRYLGNNHIKKPVRNAKVIPYENKTIPKVEKKYKDKHPWDIAQEIISERQKAALAVKWAIIPLEVLMDEHFLNVLHSIEEITDATPLRDAARQLPKQIYDIIRSQEQMTRIPGELTDQLIFDLVKTYYYSVIECLCKLIKSIQQGQRTALVSLAKIVHDQKDEIERYQALLGLPKEIRQMRQEMEKLKKHVNTQLERIDKKTSVTSVTISEIRSQVHKLEAVIEGNFDHIPEPDGPSWVFPGEIVKLQTSEEDGSFHDTHEESLPSNEYQQPKENSATGGELQMNQNNIPRRNIPAGAEGGDSSLSSSTNDEEVPLEEELARYFSNPAYRAHNPALLEPVEPEEEDWGDTPPVLLPIPIALRQPPPTSRIEKRQRFLQRRRERRRQHEWGGDQH